MHIVFRYPLIVALALTAGYAGARDRAPWPAPAHDGAPLVGVQVKLQSFTADDAQRIRHAGFGFVRMGVWTDRLAQPAYRATVDAAVATAHAAHLPVLLTIRALEPLAPRDAPPDRRAALLAEAGASMAGTVMRLADAYRARLLAIELWNEPDLAKYWPTGDVDTTFAPFMQAVCARFGARRPNVPVIGFAFSRAPFAGSAPDRLLEPLAPSLAGCVDAISYHAYGMTPAQIRAAAQDVRARYGLPVAITEDGATSVGPDGDRRQVQRLTTLLRASGELETPLISIYEWADTPNGPDAAQRNYGLVRADRTAKPALDAVEQALRAGQPHARSGRPNGGG
ncbi:glycoside hydrolase family protein [Burkholderia metallica]|uniref:glycoside hydrolase family protein n=1 Tax=Burkholderia metallica TaxID=488729 RepID=UPI001CF5321E|nr:glycoside hydrolase family protein [Burkholderia metallica]MCA8000425.1 glycoside hydrolase family protein [Burkholderia metallica]